MIVVCPKCNAKYRVDESKIKTMEVRLKCSKCGNIFVFSTEQVKEAATAVPEKEIRKEERGEKILVANDGEIITSLIVETLKKANFEVIVAVDGEETLRKIEKENPDVVILDIALPKIYGFEICEKLRNNEKYKNMIIIFVASIYDKTKYKRSPESLYGADDYIEKHHIEGDLIEKVKKLIGSRGGKQKVSGETAFSKEELTERKVQEDTLRAEEIKVSEQLGEEEHKLHEKAKRFARIVISDIALYNEELVVEGIKNNTFHDLLKTEIEEGRELYAQRVPAHIIERTNYYNEAIENFIKKRNENVNKILN